MLFNKPLTEPDHVWKDWAIAVLLWGICLGCLGGSSSLNFERFKYLRLALSGMSVVSAGLALCKVRQIEQRSPYIAQREIMRNDLFLECQAMQIPSFQQQALPPAYQQPLMMPANEQQQNSGLYDWGRLIYEAVGIIIAGNSGAGKTSVASLLLGLLTQSEPKKIIVCDPHFNKIWQQIGLKSIGRIPDIERNLAAYVEEMDRRYDALADGADPAQFEPMIIVLDELGKCQKKFSDPSGIEDAIARLGCEGRKVGMTAIIICHSQNVEDMGISKKLRNNYVLILLGASALDHAEMKWKTGDSKRAFIESQAYPCIVSGSVRDCPALHPTHHQYTEYKIQGNKPLNLLPINQITVGDRPIIPSNSPAPPMHPAPHLHQTRTSLEALLSLECTDAPRAEMMAVQCPKCDSTDTRTNGTRGNKTRYRCKSCGSSWSE